MLLCISFPAGVGDEKLTKLLINLKIHSIMNNNEELESITEQFKKAALDSQDVEFIDMVERNLVKANDNVEKVEECAQIATIFMKKGHNCIKKFLTEYHNSNVVVFERIYIYPDVCDYDVGSLMDCDFINEIAQIAHALGLHCWELLKRAEEGAP